MFITNFFKNRLDDAYQAGMKKLIYILIKDGKYIFVDNESKIRYIIKASVKKEEL